MGVSDPAFSPDGHALVFSRSTGYGNGDLYLLPLSASGVPMGEAKRLTLDNRGNFGAAWTPDGSDIIFESGALAGETLWRMAAFGSGKPRRLPSIGEEGSHVQPAISRQGHRLAYTHALFDDNIWRVGLGPQGKANVQCLVALLELHLDSFVERAAILEVFENEAEKVNVLDPQS